MLQNWSYKRWNSIGKLYIVLESYTVIIRSSHLETFPNKKKGIQKIQWDQMINLIGMDYGKQNEWDRLW